MLRVRLENRDRVRPRDGTFLATLKRRIKGLLLVPPLLLALEIVLNLERIRFVYQVMDGLSIIGGIVGLGVYLHLLPASPWTGPSTQVTASTVQTPAVVAPKLTARLDISRSGVGLLSLPPQVVAPGEAIQLLVTATNDGPETASDTTLRADIPEGSSPIWALAGVVTSRNGAASSDTKTFAIKDGSAQYLSYRHGSTRVYTPACAGCIVDDVANWTGINVGDLAAGEKAKLYFMGYVTPAPSD